jgi:hypothetical protein
VVQLPLWLVMLPFVVWFGVAYLRRRRRLTAGGLCRCGYDARGLDVCPECGRAVEGKGAES